jgi:hypothetical protein
LLVHLPCACAFHSVGKFVVAGSVAVLLAHPSLRCPCLRATARPVPCPAVHGAWTELSIRDRTLMLLNRYVYKYIHLDRKVRVPSDPIERGRSVAAGESAYLPEIDPCGSCSQDSVSAPRKYSRYYQSVS